jgi:16S rRNA (uracil1498-N3)-methyltransferase
VSTAPVFYVEDVEKVRRGDRLTLGGPEGRHAALVRRLTAGERLDLCAGYGVVAECVVTTAHKEKLDVEVRDVVTEPEPAPRVVVVQALPKGDRGEVAVETMTEVGVDVIVPWAAARSVTQWRGDRGDKALAKWRATAREAAKQSRRSWWPVVAPLSSTPEVAKLLGAATQALVLHEDAALSLARLAVERSGDVVLVVGPEGSISPQEMELFHGAGALAYQMGPTVLRTSTAGTAAATVVLANSGRWG